MTNALTTQNLPETNCAQVFHLNLKQGVSSLDVSMVCYQDQASKQAVGDETFEQDSNNILGSRRYYVPKLD
jgi:hypothetical protein